MFFRGDFAMEKGQQKTIGLVLIDGFADWEFGLLSAGAAENLGAKVVFLSPEKRAVKSIGGLEARTSRGISPEENDDLDAVALVGSDTWAERNAPDVAPLLKMVQKRGGVIGGICAGTIALTKGGFVKGHKHTSNGKDWIKANAGDYPGADMYQDVPHAVGDNHVITAPGTAPVTFASEFLTSVFPEKRDMISGVKDMFAAEHS
jgi:putative intracellular protease/amidase